MLFVCLAWPVAELRGETVTLASRGQATWPVVVAPEAGEEVRQAASELARYLGRIAGAEFSVQAGTGTTGIAVGTAGDFPELAYGDRWPQAATSQREHYRLRSHARGLHLIGATPLAVRHAVWDLLHRLGYRQYFPGPHWELVPSTPELAVQVADDQAPDYAGRRIWYGFGGWDYAAEPYDQWCQRNRAVQGVALSTGHAYGGIIRACQTEFDRHPEYYALVDGRRHVHPQAKLCISNADLRKVVVDYAVRYFEENPAADSISMDPSDGGGWCECEACRQVGPPSDRALLLANDVAAAVNERHPGKLVGMYAYSYHSPPPSLRVHPQVVISVATAFLKGGLTLDEILTGWQRQGAALGIREYYSVHTWDRDLPAAARGGRLDYLQQTIPDFYNRGARYLSAESSDNWGPNGLGYYLAARMMWDVDEAQRLDELVEEFLTRCFGSAKEPMRTFYKQLDGSRPHLVFDDQLGRMFRALADARSQTDDPDVLTRINDLLLYARYVDLFDRYRQASGDDRQAAFEQLVRHTYRMRTTMLVHAKALYRDLAARDKSVSIPDEARWNVPEPKNPWKSSQPFTDGELERFLREGIDGRRPVELTFDPVQFSDDLVPATALKLAAVRPSEAIRGRGHQMFLAYVEQPQRPLELHITGGLIAHYRDRGNVRVQVWQVGGSSATGERETLVAEDRSVPPDGQERTIRLAVREAGLHRIDVTDGGDLTRVSWPPGQRICYQSSLDQPLKPNGRWTLYFYVPPKTRTIGLFGGGSPGTIVDPAGRKALALGELPTGYHSVPVPEGTAGKLWRIEQAAGDVRLLTVPPQLARSGEELLLPREIVPRP
ncbi:MAG: DUF4838 domain-containing protein [Pirellulaceae bacterium]|nr:DUF4838 domain-containing protein [Pirellulaceae bacterium]